MNLIAFILNTLEKVQQQVVQTYLNNISLPEIEKIAEREWKSHIGKLAWERVKGGFSEKVRESFLMLSAGKSTKEIAEELEIEQNTVNVYKKRIQEKLFREIKLLNNELGEG